MHQPRQDEFLLGAVISDALQGSPKSALKGRGFLWLINVSLQRRRGDITERRVERPEEARQAREGSSNPLSSILAVKDGQGNHERAPGQNDDHKRPRAWGTQPEHEPGYCSDGRNHCAQRDHPRQQPTNAPTNRHILAPKCATKGHEGYPSRDPNTAKNASCGTSTVPNCFIRAFPFFCFSSNFFLRVMSPP